MTYRHWIHNVFVSQLRLICDWVTISPLVLSNEPEVSSIMENTGFAQLQVEAAGLDSKLRHEIAGLAGAKRTTRNKK